MFNRSGQGTPKKPTPTWFKWAMLGFIAYAFFVHWTKAPTPSAPAGSTAPPVAEQDDKSDIVLPDSAEVEGFMDKVFPGSAMGIQARDITSGEGDPALCGQNVAIRYEAFLKDNTKVDGNRDAAEPLRFALGRGQVMPALEKATLGMKKGGKRLMYSPAEWAYGASGHEKEGVPQHARMKFEVELLDASPNPPDTSMGLRIFDQVVGIGDPAACGDLVHAHVTVWGADGAKLFNSRDANGGAPVAFRLGGGQVFYGLEKGTLGLRQLGKRSLVVPASMAVLFNPKGALAPVKGLAAGSRQALVVDIERVTD